MCCESAETSLAVRCEALFSSQQPLCQRFPSIIMSRKRHHDDAAGTARAPAHSSFQKKPRPADAAPSHRGSPPSTKRTRLRASLRAAAAAPASVSMDLSSGISPMEPPAPASVPAAASAGAAAPSNSMFGHGFSSVMRKIAAAPGTSFLFYPEAAAAAALPLSGSKSESHLSAFVREHEAQLPPYANAPFSSAAEHSGGALASEHMLPGHPRRQNSLQPFVSQQAGISLDAPSAAPPLGLCSAAPVFTRSAAAAAAMVRQATVASASASTSPLPSTFFTFSKSNIQSDGEPLGQGGCGAVFAGKISANTTGLSSGVKNLGEDIAIKTLPLHALQRKDRDMLFERLREEARQQSQLVHPNVLPLRGVIDDEEAGAFSLVMSLMRGGSLRQLLRLRGSVLTISEKINLSQQCAQAVEYIHTRAKPIVHRDIKSENFLIDEHGDVKLGEITVRETRAQHWVVTH
jgi:hypothetical protein